MWGMPMKKKYFGNSISSLFQGHICQILSFGRPHRTQQHYSAEKRPSKNDLWDQKVIIKGMKFQEASLGLLLRIVLLGNGNYVINILMITILSI